MNVEEILDKTIGEYVDEKYKYEMKIDLIKTTKIKDILVNAKGQRLELFKDELKQLSDMNVNININNIIMDYYKHNFSTPGQLNIAFELQQTVINTNLLIKSKSHESIIKNLISRMEIQEEKTKDNIQNYILVKLQNQDNIINNLNKSLDYQNRKYYYTLGAFFMVLLYRIFL